MLEPFTGRSLMTVTSSPFFSSTPFTSRGFSASSSMPISAHLAVSSSRYIISSRSRAQPSVSEIRFSWRHATT
ncbi:Uncharacterised protein [Vibrio cholerae]|uniref:Uncharacterized protein n=1 Tax=Vibrio cholerae TaxID=666 RepID=A0A655RIX2_VIBCL|nr:Uncharacterised protein [Vibrio cholerae]